MLGMQPPDYEAKRLTRVLRLVLWGTAVGVGLAILFCLGFLMFEVPLLRHAANAVFLLSTGVGLVVAPAWLWLRGPAVIRPKIGELIDWVLLEAAALFLLYIFDLHGGFTGVGVAVLVALGFGVLVSWFAWLVRRHVRRHLRQHLTECGEVPSACDHNLTGNVSGVCPECGTEVERSESARTADR